MVEIKIISWFIWVMLSIFAVFEFVGICRLVRMFPEGGRWWITPGAWCSLLIFAWAVLAHPF